MPRNNRRISWSHRILSAAPAAYPDLRHIFVHDLRPAANRWDKMPGSSPCVGALALHGLVTLHFPSFSHTHTLTCYALLCKLRNEVSNKNTDSKKMQSSSKLRLRSLFRQTHQAENKFSSGGRAEAITQPLSQPEGWRVMTWVHCPTHPKWFKMQLDTIKTPSWSLWVPTRFMTWFMLVSPLPASLSRLNNSSGRKEGDASGLSSGSSNVQEEMSWRFLTA